MSYKFVPYRGNKTNDKEHAKEKTEIRSHASLRGYHNAQRKKAKLPQTEKALVSTQKSISNALPAAVNALIPANIKLRVTIKNRRPVIPSLSRNSSSRSDVSQESSASDIELPSPKRLLSAELNNPKYLYLWANKLFPGFQAAAKCFNTHDVQAISAIRPYLNYEVFENTLASLSHALANFHAGADNLQPKEVLLHRGKAIKLLRSHLDAGESHSAVFLAILYMIMLDMLLDNTQAADRHKKILRHLIQRNGGLESLEEHVISVILQQDEYWTSIGLNPITESLPIPTTLEFPTAETSLALQEATSLLPPGFRELTKKGEVAACNLEFLLRITEAHQDHQQRLQRQESLAETPKQHDLTISGPRHRYRSFLDALPVLAMPDSDDIMFQKLLCCALVVHSTIFLDKPATFMHHMTKARSELTTKLPDLSKQLTPFYHQEQCLFWIWHVCVTSWGSEPERTSLEEMQKIRFQAFYDTQRTETILGGFSWGQQEGTIDRPYNVS